MSEELLRTFRVGHQSIVDTIDVIQMSLRSYSAAKPKIRELEKKLTAHFSRQNQAFWDKLTAHVQSDRESLKMIEFLTFNLKDIKVKFLMFYDKHTGEMNDNHARTFPKDFSDFSTELIAYLKMEEEYLSPLLEKLPS